MPRRADERFDHGGAGQQPAVGVGVQSLIVQGLLFHPGQDVEMPAAGLIAGVAAVWIADPHPAPATSRKELLCVLVLQAGGRHLLQIVGADRPPGRLAGGLHGRQQQRDQNADDRNHDQQLDQRETAPLRTLHGGHTGALPRPCSLPPRSIMPFDQSLGNIPGPVRGESPGRNTSGMIGDRSPNAIARRAGAGWAGSAAPATASWSDSRSRAAAFRPGGPLHAARSSGRPKPR